MLGKKQKKWLKVKQILNILYYNIIGINARTYVFPWNLRHKTKYFTIFSLYKMKTEKVHDGVLI